MAASLGQAQCAPLRIETGRLRIEWVGPHPLPARGEGLAVVSHRVGAWIRRSGCSK